MRLAEDHLEVSSRPGRAQPIKILVGDRTVELAPGTRHEFALASRP